MMKNGILRFLLCFVLAIPALAASPLPVVTKLPGKTALLARVDMRKLEKAPGADELLQPIFERFRSHLKPEAKGLFGPKLIANLNYVLLFSEVPDFVLSRSFSTNAPTAVYLSGEFGEQRVLWELEKLGKYRAFDIDGTKVVSSPVLGDVLVAFPNKELILVANGSKTMASALRSFNGKAGGLSAKSAIATISKSEGAPFLCVLDPKGHVDMLTQLAGGVSLGQPVVTWFTVSPITQGASTEATHSRVSMSFQFASEQEAQIAWRTFNALRVVIALNPDASPELMAAIGKASVGAKGKIAYATFDLDKKTAAAFAKMIQKKK